jgi:glutaredoxin 3
MTTNNDPQITMYGTETCPFCTAARMLLTKKGVSYEEFLVSRDPELRAKMEDLSGRRTVPQIFINDESIGGFDELYSLEQQGKLNDLLAPEYQP